MISFSELYLYSEQPTCCPKCGARTSILLDLSHTVYKIQIHVCLFLKCKYEFVTTE